MQDNARTTPPHPFRHRRVSAELLCRVRAEYREMPGLSLTAAQAARLWGLTPRVCAAVLQALVADGTLLRTPDVRYVAAPTAPVSLHPSAEWARRRGAA